MSSNALRHFLVAVGASIVAVGLAARPAEAANIDFDTGLASDAGTISYAGGANPLIGLNISIGAVRGNGTPSNAGVIDTVTGGILDFTTGAFSSFNAGTNTYTFSGGGSFTITGTTAAGCTTAGGCGGNTPNTTSSGTLLTGSLVSATYNVGTGTLDLATLSGTDTKAATLVQFFGYISSTVFLFGPGTVHASLTSGDTGGAGGAFTSASQGSTDIPNSPLSGVPEPGSMLLLGTGLVGIANAARRRIKKG